MQPIMSNPEKKKLACATVAIHAAVFAIAMLIIPRPNYAAIFNCPSGDADCLIESINRANKNDEDDVIRLRHGTYTLTKDQGALTGLPLITSTVNIKGAGAERTTIERDANAAPFRIFAVDRGGTLKLNRLTISGGRLKEGGGGAIDISNEGTATVANSTLRDNASICGGAIQSNGRVTILDSRIVGNKTVEFDGAGGGICNQGEVTLINSVVRNNLVPCNTECRGGGIFSDGGIVITDRSRIIGNKVQGGSGEGGGIWGVDVQLILFDSIVRGNVAARRGGGILNAGGLGDKLTFINRSLISDNEAQEEGGGIFHDGRDLIILSSRIAKNKAGSTGGGIFINEGNVTITNSHITLNKAGADGGGIFNQNGTVLLDSTAIKNNVPNDCTGCR